MSTIELLDSHEKDASWTKLWKLTDLDKTGEFTHYKGLSLGERKEWIAYMQDILEDNRRNLIGDRLGPPDTSTTKREAEDTKVSAAFAANFEKLHDPANYSFGEERLWIPWAEDATSGAKRGRYADRYPRGMVLHWTAGHRNGLKAGNKLMRDTGMLYLLGDAEGRIAQSDALDNHGYHAGKSSHKYARGYVSDEYVGLEQQAAGMLTKRGGKYYSWFKKEFPASEVVSARRDENIAPGHYHVFTVPQMIATRMLVAWLYLNNPRVFSISRVVGHDEVSPGRKVDPGGSVIAIENGKPITMSDFRRICENDIDRIFENRR